MVLKGVDIESRKMMQAVTALCPNLREVQFRRYGFIGAHDRLSVQELHSILLINQENFGCWLKVDLEFPQLYNFLRYHRYLFTFIFIRR